MPPAALAPDPLFVAFQTALAGRYSIDREIGRGGMGVVYLAREVMLDRAVAIKLLPPAMATQPALRDRFLREAQLAAKLSHPHIVPIHSVDTIDDFVFFVMAYVEGETLAQRVQSRGPLPAREGARVLREVAWALGYAHAQQVVHRDVKPDNILLEANTGRALVADFGIAAATGDAISDQIAGTPDFMSPEQILGADIDARSDLYSLGATAFYALSGALPFSDANTSDVLARRLTTSAPSLDTTGTRVPRKLTQLVDWCLATHPADRPASAQLLADQLGVAIEQRRELPVALRAFVKRNGRTDGAGTMLTLVGTVVGAGVVAAVAGPAQALAATAISALVAPAAFGVLSARRMLDLGFTHQDLWPAFDVERESSREEHAVHPGRLRRVFERVLRHVARVSSATTAAVIPALALATPMEQLYAVPLVLLCLAVAISSVFGYLVVLQLRRDVDVEFWSRVWTGRFGAWSFALARKWRGRAPVAPAMTHRATELSLGLAAEQLFDSLPKASRESLGDLPALIERLQRDAHVLRTRFDALQQALHGSGQGAAASSHAESSHQQALAEERDMVQARLRETVSALENIRLGLLRLHAGSLSLGSLTTHIALAVDVSENVDRLIQAHDDVEHLLRLPQQISLTPA
ncbi:serine/threonine-protein kinase [Gemmatimonas sp.]|jgi:serine/threonine-protein kinase|uniref:serine/threonine-protein kinase n=1 Tax=Gemmatimonas sp. TaxID=1962908 RepID=UPI0022CB505D|nr:serine/threonine-protein kinase [Gemmatimonas sp.]MCZ8206471.1 serine/threonine-protein kinase [Gemmatimonas sp.]